MACNQRKRPLPRLRQHGSAYLYIPLHQLRVRPPGYPSVPEQIDWHELFANGVAPVNLDVGCGEGGFLLRFAREHPYENILGLEVRKTLVQWLEGVIRDEQIPNAAVLWYSVVNGLRFLESSSVRRIFYLFPDPWPKKRHHKRRALSVPLLQEFARVLCPEGLLFWATDSPDLEAYHWRVLSEFGQFCCETVVEDSDWGIPLTDREQACRRGGIPYVRVRCWKRCPVF
ncbi:MAG: hypothetical protein NZ473_07535 [Candidatus Kapabacteria bacterium]|nr:hypothetical protein [Candidatus Kapabacteria bacterium]